MTRPQSHLTDEMVHAASEGDAEQQSRVIAAMAEAVRAMVVVRLAPTAMRAHDVDDIVQDSLTAISEGLPTLREPSVPVLRGFASTIVSRKVANYLSKDQRRQGRQPLSLDVAAGEGSSAGVLRHLLSASGISPGSVAARREQIHNVLAHLTALNDSHREVITMSVIDQLPITEVARRMEISRPAASMLLFRAMKTLRRNVTGSSQLGEKHDSGS